MSYARQLDDYTWKELRDEIERRVEKNSLGLCHYCGNLISSQPCLSSDAHRNVRYLDRTEQR
jgi:hypothetical protein